jgi:hypothetical protein
MGWDGSLDDDLGDVTGGGGSNNYGSDGGDYSGGMSAGDNPSSDGGGDGDLSVNWDDPFQSIFRKAKEWTADPVPVDPYTGNPQTDVWDESNMDLLPDPGQSPREKIGKAGVFARLFGILTGNPAVYGAGWAAKKMTDVGDFAGSILPDSNYLTPSMVPGTDQYAEAHPGGPSGGPGGGGGTPGAGPAAGGGAMPTKEDMANLYQQMLVQRAMQGMGSLGGGQPNALSLGNIGKIPSGYELRRPKTTLFR